MEENSASFIRLGEDGQNAPVLSYSIPESTNYVGTSIITVDIDEKLLNDKTRSRIKKNLQKKLDKKNTPKTNFKGPEGLIFSIKKPKPDRFKNTLASTPSNAAISSAFVESEAMVSPAKEIEEFATVNPGLFIYKPTESMNRFSGSLGITTKPREDKIRPKILFYERFQLSNFLGNYGAGRVIKTFSLFPGEKTKITIKTYDKTKSTENHGSSILDSVTDEASTDFENSIMSETSSKHEDYEADILNSERDFSSSDKEGSASASGFGFSVAASGKVSSTDETERAGEWGTRSAREEFGKNVSNALSKHSSRASSKRDVEINTSKEMTKEEGTETEIERVIENVNVSRTLNLVFRQMVQEFISVLHLTDVKIALYDESIAPYPQYSIYELDRFLEENFDKKSWGVIKGEIIRELYYVFNHQDKPKQFLEKASLEFPAVSTEGLGFNLPERVEYFRVRKDVKEKLNEEEHAHIEVPGVILKANFMAMRTEGVVVDAFLGQGEALDTYSQGLQTETVRELHLKNNRKGIEIEKLNLAKSLVDGNDANKAAVFEKVYPHCLEKNGHSTENNNTDNDE